MFVKVVTAKIQAQYYKIIYTASEL